MECVLKIHVVLCPCLIKTCKWPWMGSNNGVSDGLRRRTHRLQIRRSPENPAVLFASEHQRLKCKCVICIWLRSQNYEKPLLALSCLSVRPSVCLPWWKHVSQYKNFHEIWYLRTSRKSVKKIHLPLKSDKKNVRVTVTLRANFYSLIFPHIGVTVIAQLLTVLR